jgi:hypothetical protein
MVPSKGAKKFIESQNNNETYREIKTLLEEAHHRSCSHLIFYPFSCTHLGHLLALSSLAETPRAIFRHGFG